MVAHHHDLGRLLERAFELGRARLDVDVEPSGDPVAQVAVERALDLSAHLVRRTDDEPLDDAALRELEELFAGVLEVVLGLLLDAALEPGLRPTTLVVPS